MSERTAEIEAQVTEMRRHFRAALAECRKPTQALIGMRQYETLLRGQHVQRGSVEIRVDGRTEKRIVESFEALILCVLPMDGVIVI